MSIDTSVGRVEGVRVSIDTSVQVSGQGSGLAERAERCRCRGLVPNCHGRVVVEDLLGRPRTGRHAHHMSQIAPNGVSRDLAPLERSLSEARLPTGRL